MVKRMSSVKIYCSESFRYLKSEKVLGIAMVLAFFTYLYVSPVKDFSIRMNYPTTPWLWFFLFSGLYYDVIILLGAIYLYSQAPFLNRGQMYIFMRIGRVEWIRLQLFKIVNTALIYVFFLFGVTVIIMSPYIEFQGGWGKVLYTLSMTNAGDSIGLPYEIGYQIIAKHEPFLLFLKAIAVTWGVVVFIGFLMFGVALYISKQLSVVISTFFACMPIIIENARRAEQQLLVQTIPTEWIKITKIGAENFEGVQSLDFFEILLRLLVVNGCIAGLILLGKDKAQYNWQGER